MKLIVDPEQIVFRWSRPNGTHGAWHILFKTAPTGFTKENAPKFPTWWNTTTYKALCGHWDDDRPDLLDGYVKGHVLEFSTVGKIKGNICTGCYPPARLPVITMHVSPDVQPETIEALGEVMKIVIAQENGRKRIKRRKGV